MSRAGELSEADAETRREAAKLWLVSTPIGNIGDLSARAVEVLAQAGAIACEDTRVTRTLLEQAGLKDKRLIACHDHNEAASAGGVVKLISGGQHVALVSDAGAPAISDPGYRVVRAVIEAGFEVTSVPGPSAVIAALSVSGLPTDQFAFLGFPPRKPGKRARLFEARAEDPATLVLFESPQRLAETLAAAQEALGDRNAAVCFELTKAFERIHRGPLSTLAPLYAELPKGEAVIVIEGARMKREHRNKYAPDGGKKR